MTGFAPQKHFFAGGICFECTRCGACCTGAPGKVRISDQELAALAELLGRPAEELRRAFCRVVEGEQLLQERPDGQCVFYDQGCAVYATRPRQCRTYPFWTGNLRSGEAWRRTCAECEGIGRGRRYSAEEILGFLAEDP